MLSVALIFDLERNIHGFYTKKKDTWLKYQEVILKFN